MKACQRSLIHQWSDFFAESDNSFWNKKKNSLIFLYSHCNDYDIHILKFDCLIDIISITFITKDWQFSCKEPKSNYFRLVATYSICRIFFVLQPLKNVKSPDLQNLPVSMVSALPPFQPTSMLSLSRELERDAKYNTLM